MYWGQIALATATAIGTGWFAVQRGHEIVTALTIAVIAYISVRWTIAWVYRVRYWYNRGTQGIYSRSCSNCGKYIYRRSGDWILRCGRCGWTAGWPIVRWVIQSVPARQLRRTVVGPQLVVVLIAVGLVASGATAGVNLSEPMNSDLYGQQDNAETRDVQGIESHNFNETKVEQKIFAFVNEKRSLRNKPNYVYNSRAVNAAREHAEDMAEKGYFSHTSLSGETQQERYAFCHGGENAAKNHIREEIQQADGDIVRYQNETELARGIVEQWMHSDPHRERGIYGKWWKSAGVGVAITENGTVYAVMGFCSK